MPGEESNASSSVCNTNTNDALHKDLYEKYEQLPKYVHSLEPIVVAQIFKESKGPNTFYTFSGLFFHEFALGYCMNLSK